MRLERCPGGRSIPELLSDLEDVAFGAFVAGTNSVGEDDFNGEAQENASLEIRRLVLDTLEQHGVDVTDWRTP